MLTKVVLVTFFEEGLKSSRSFYSKDNSLNAYQRLSANDHVHPSPQNTYYICLERYICQKVLKNTAFRLFLNGELPQFQYLLVDVEILYFCNTQCK